MHNKSTGLRKDPAASLDLEKRIVEQEKFVASFLKKINSFSYKNFSLKEEKSEFVFPKEGAEWYTEGNIQKEGLKVGEYSIWLFQHPQLRSDLTDQSYVKFSWLKINEEYQQQGLGRKMFDYVVDLSRQKGFEEFHIWATGPGCFSWSRDYSWDMSNQYRGVTHKDAMKKFGNAKVLDQLEKEKRISIKEREDIEYKFANGLFKDSKELYYFKKEEGWQEDNHSMWVGKKMLLSLGDSGFEGKILL